MNGKAFFIVAVFCIGMWLNISFCSENQSDWFGWLRSKLTSARSSKVASIVQQKALAEAITLASTYAGIESTIITDVVSLFSALLEDIEPIISSYRTGSVDRDEAIRKIKEDVLILINNALLYPTRSSKINALLKKDEFLQYTNDQDDLVQEACNQLIREISAIDYSEAKKTADEAVDAKMATLRAAIIIHGQLLTKQIHELEVKLAQTQHFDIPEMQAYLSLYFRLKNKQKVERKLTIEEKAFQQPWAINESEIEKRIVSEPAVD